MNIFPAIKDAIFGKKAAQSSAPQPRPASVAPPSTAPAQQPAPAPVAVMEPVDVEAVMEKVAADYGQPSNWRTSIVDLMKLLDIDSSLGNRKALASELGYTGDTNDSATMNTWLHKQVMKKLSENGGKVPDSLKD